MQEEPHSMPLEVQVVEAVQEPLDQATTVLLVETGGLVFSHTSLAQELTMLLVVEALPMRREPVVLLAQVALVVAATVPVEMERMQLLQQRTLEVVVVVEAPAHQASLVVLLEEPASSSLGIPSKV